MNNIMDYYIIPILIRVAFFIILSFTISMIFNEVRYFFKKDEDYKYKRTFIENYTTKKQSKFYKAYSKKLISGEFDDEDFAYWLMFGTMMTLNVVFLGILYYFM